MFEQLLITSCGVGTVLAGVTIIGGNLYEIQQVRAQRQLRAQPHARRYRQRPLISVLVYTHNDAATISPCLQALTKSSYRKLEIVVVDACSRDNTRKLVKQFIASHPRKMVKLSMLRKQQPHIEAISSVYKKHATGQLIMSINATDLIDSQALNQAVTQFNARDDVSIVSFSRQLRSVSSLAGLFQTFEFAMRSRSDKVDSVFNSNHSFYGSGALYKRDMFRQMIRDETHGSSRLSLLEVAGNKFIKVYYCHEAVIYSVQHASLGRLVTSRYHLQSSRMSALIRRSQLLLGRGLDDSWFQKWLRLPLSYIVGTTALLLPLFLSYFIYLALKLHQPTLYLLSWAVISLSLALAILGSGHYGRGRKLIYILLSPITYAVVYLLSFVQLFSLLGLVLRRVLRQSTTRPKTI